ncbi:MAG: S-layer homology domain-containing protein [Syntrophomonadaceae bacterium]|nr:S-layer homology domain-containing protein [Syntrophomonadaceae bacterium]MDD3889335.1 S-layer homology domain-containing protein [Syntrophomonadaceae bacterium]MDD4549759.1 S-layer homology domain-containing protein [Syntrophomonadaceae bacterium]
MKKTLTFVLALLLVVVLSTGTAMAKPDNGNAWGQVKKLEKQQNYGQLKKAEKHQARELVKKSLQEEYQVFSKEKTKQSKKVQLRDISRHWAAPCIEEMTAIGLFKGYPDGSFKPDQKLTQAEALALVMRIAEDYDLNVEVDADKSELSKVPAWVRGDADKAARRGFIKLNRFHSAVQASRAQTAVMIAKALGLEPVDTSDMPFKDGILISEEDVGYILALYQEGILQGNPNGNFNPNSAITRAEMASILQRLLDQEDIISIDLPRTATVEEGKSITLKATVKYPNDSSDNDNSIRWSSSNTALATVKDGVVTAADDKTGTVTITATAKSGELTASAKCKVTVVEEEQVTTATLKETGDVEKHDGKVYQEYVLRVDGDKISLHKDNVESITLQKDDDSAVKLTANTDSTLWFDVQRKSGDYTLRVVDTDDNIYEAVLDWTAPRALIATATGNEGEYDGNDYAEYQLGNLDLSSFSYMYQIKPDGKVVELTDNSDSTLWFKTDNQLSGKHTFLIKKSGTWYTAIIRF